jgi:transcriptional regulator with XRE-family HTH domain
MRGLKQAELARRANMDKQTIYRLEHEEKPRRLSIVGRVEEALDIEVAVLTGEKPIPAGLKRPEAAAEETLAGSFGTPCPLRRA